MGGREEGRREKISTINSLRCMNVCVCVHACMCVCVCVCVCVCLHLLFTDSKPMVGTLLQVLQANDRVSHPGKQLWSKHWR